MWSRILEDNKWDCRSGRCIAVICGTVDKLIRGRDILQLGTDILCGYDEQFSVRIQHVVYVTRPFNKKLRFWDQAVGFVGYLISIISGGGRYLVKYTNFIRIEAFAKMCDTLTAVHGSRGIMVILDLHFTFRGTSARPCSVDTQSGDLISITR